MVESNTTDEELQRMCTEQTETQRDKDREKGMQEERKSVSFTVSNCKKETQREKVVTLMKKKGVRLTCPAAGGACPPSPGVGLAGLC